MSFNITTDIFNVYEEKIIFSSNLTYILGGGGVDSAAMFRQL